ncbi:MAG: RnfABCDGE type electron transport complex subunit D, partial [Culicoidibacterales bacterium]
MKFSTKKPSPSLRSPQSTQRMMNDIIVCMLILSVVAIATQWYLNGMEAAIQASLLIGSAAATSLLVEWGLLTLKGTKKSFNAMVKSYPIITGLMLVLLVPIGTPIWLVVLGTTVAIVAGKFVYGGLGKNLFNPALVGRIFV